MNFLSDKRLFYPGVLVLAWIILTPLHSYPWCMFALTGLLAALAGVWFAGERSMKHFLIGLGGTILLSFPAVVANALENRPLKTMLKELLPNDYQWRRAFLASETIPDWTTWTLICLVILVTIVLFIVFFNCRILVGNPYLSFPAAIVALGIASLTFTWTFYGLLAFHVFLTPKRYTGIFFMEKHMIPALCITIILLFLLLFFWTFLNLRRNGPNWKKLLKDIGLTAGVCVFVWLAAAVVALAYGHAAIAESAHLFPMAKRPGVPQAMLDADEKQNEWFRKFNEENPDFQLPMESVRSWFTGIGNPVTEKMRKTTLDIFQSPQGADYFRRNSELIARYKEELPLYDWNFSGSISALNGWRASARRTCSRAELLAYLGREKEVLPALEELVGFENAIEKNQQTLYESIILRAIWFIRSVTIIQFGPLSPEYASFYRKELDTLLNSRIRIPNEAPRYAREIERVFRLCPYNPESGNSLYNRILSFPFSAIIFGRDAFALMKHKEEIERLANQSVIGKTETDSSRTTAVEEARMTCLHTAYTKSIMTAALALKWYRCEKGHYPKTLQELTPEFLKQLPVDPADGAPLVYELLPDGSFRLDMPSSKHLKIKSRLEFLE
ncbi:MAG: hypothetical protein BWY31_00251 [Lentisphaerae bacterium ADurb.Bin242]|nr:MAG: hypothetical protein BWY31_00251 [Lentisphaerae bacterium ADurb.Bin242]